MPLRPFTVHGIRFRCEVQTEVEIPRYLLSEVRRSVRAALLCTPLRRVRKALGTPIEVGISITLVGDRKMRKLNATYRAKDRTTDVLAFSRIEGKLPAGFQLPMLQLGDVVVSVPQMLRQAREYQTGNRGELQRLIVHGTLHLLGMDHERSKAEAKEMFRLQNAALRSLRK